MGKLVKWLVGIFIGILIITGISAGVLIALIDEDMIKEQLAKAAHDSTGGDLSIDGDLGWSVFPELGVSVSQLQFTPEGESEALAAVGTLRLGIDFMPLFSGQLNVGEITLSGVRVNLVRAKDGTGNWENLVDSAADTAAEDTPATVRTDDDEKTALTLAISKLHIDDTELSYTDEQSGEHQKLSDFSLDSKGVNLEGNSFPASIGFTVDSSTPQMTVVFTMDTLLSGDLPRQRLVLNDTRAKIEMSGEANNGATISTTLATDANIDLKADTAELRNLLLEIADLKLSGELSAKQLSTSPRVNARLESEAFNPRQLAEQLTVELPSFKNNKAMSHAKIGMSLVYDGASARLEELQVELDETRIEGSAAIADLQKQAVTASLSVDQFNLDTYQLVAEEASTETAEPNAGEKETAATEPMPLLPVEAVKQLNIDAKLDVGKLTANQIELTAVTLLLKARDGLVEIPELSAKLYQGSTDFSASVDVRPKQPLWRFNGRIEQVQIAPLLQTVSDIDWVEGEFNLNGKLSSQGNQKDSLKRNLKGPASLTISKGVLKNMNLEKNVCQAIALINSKQLSKSWGPDSPMQNIEARLKFTDGKIINETLTAGLENTSLKGDGEINMLDNTIDYGLGIRIAGELEEVDPACEVNKRYKDIYWPIRCEGSLSDEPGDLCGIDNDRLTEITTKMAEEELKGRATEAAEKAIGDALKRFLK